MKTQKKSRIHRPPLNDDYVEQLVKETEQKPAPPVLSITDIALIGAIIFFFIFSGYLWIRYPVKATAIKQNIPEKSNQIQISDEIQAQIDKLAPQPLAEVSENDPQYIDGLSEKITNSTSNENDPLAFERKTQPEPKTFVEEIPDKESPHTPSKFEIRIDETTP